MPYQPLLVWILACSAPAPQDDPVLPGMSEVRPDVVTSSTSSDTGMPRVEEVQVDGLDDPAAWIFDDTVLHAVEITLSAEAVAALDAEPYTWVEGEVAIDGLPAPSVGVRLRGKIGSFRELDDKPKLGIDFDQFVDDQRFYGLKRLDLNNSVNDCTFLREPLAYRIYEEAGVEVPRVAFTRVWVNGEDKGLYHLIEHPDDVFLDERFPPGTGNLYDGKYDYYGGWSYTLKDFTPDVHDLFQLEEGSDVAHADIHAITRVLSDWEAGDADYAAVDALVAMEQAHPYFAAEQFVENWDAYAINTNNYRVYFDPVDGRMRFVPTDLDLSFPTSIWYDWRWPSGRLVDLCWDDPACSAAHRQAVTDLLDHLLTVDLLGQLADWAAVTEATADADPWMWCAPVATERLHLVDWLQRRDGELRSHWGL